MTRMISEIAKEQGQIKFHLTSLNPINPANEPLQWEKAALQDFEDNRLSEVYFRSSKNNSKTFHFMTPLITNITCLQCHAKQGYQEGEIRGGISVTFPIQTKSTHAILFSHLFIFFVGVALIAGFGSRIIQLTESLKKEFPVIYLKLSAL